ncbi:MAG: ParB/RepB/Spo0J family partition protein [Phycisphaerales bacterium]|nr:ParB/RepB/Spo0J family partition protein [Phycisphaerales bacterium]
MPEPVLLRVPIREIVIEGQPRRRFDAEALQSLAASIAASGLQHPPLCRKEGDRLVLVDGERRVRACLLLGVEEITVLVAEGAADAAEVLTRQLACNLQREDLGPIERAEGIRSLMERGSLTAEQAGERLGLSGGSVTKSLALLKLPPAIREHVASGTIAADAGYQLSRVADAAEQSRLAEELVCNRLTRDGLTRTLKRRRSKGSGRKAPRRVVLPAGPARTITLTGESLSIDELVECLEGLLAGARKARSQGLSLETFARAARDRACKEPS